MSLAQAVPEGDGGSALFNPLFLIAAMFLLMWALLIRPQQRQQKEHRKMLQEIQRGDQVVTSGGLHGRVTGVADDLLTVEIAQNVRVKVLKSAITTRRSGEDEGKAAKPAKEKSA